MGPWWGLTSMISSLLVMQVNACLILIDLDLLFYVAYELFYIYCYTLIFYERCRPIFMDRQTLLFYFIYLFVFPLTTFWATFCSGDILCRGGGI